ncbi:MAG: hypothetical protein U1E10_13650 [Bdellovibrionales bacterium]|nr:hypothetical protein [Bdellovibrionales bacterium]
MKDNKSLIFAGMGIEALVAVLGGFWLGDYFDHYLGSKGYGPALGCMVMLVAWFVHILAVLNKIDKEE